MTTIKDLIERLREDRARTASTVESLQSDRQRVEVSQKQLESPRAAFAHVEFFVEFFEDTIAGLNRLVAELEAAPRPEHGAALREIARRSEAAEHRCREFSDTWVSKPLPYESVRPLLGGLHLKVRDRLVEFRKLNELATDVEALTGALRPPDADAHVDRRSFLTRLTGGRRDK